MGKTISHHPGLEGFGKVGMNVVSRARDTHLDQLVATKILPPEKVANHEHEGWFGSGSLDGFRWKTFLFGLMRQAHWNEPVRQQ